MNISTAIAVYALKMGNASRQVDIMKCRPLGKSIVILKDFNGNRVACVVESKAGFTVDPVKKLHGLSTAVTKSPVALKRDSHGRFVRRG